jgi:ketosteroid isomerase-like protein
MRQITVTIGLVLAVSLVAAAQTRSENMKQNDDAKAVLMKLEREFGEAITRGDTARLGELLADDFTATNNLGQVVNKAQVIADVASSDYEIESLVNDQIEIRVYKDVAVATARGTAKGKYKGRDASGQFRYTRVWVKRGSRWQAVAAQSTTVAKP